jgi:hypothetical protein
MWLGLSIYMHLLFFSIQDSIQINHKKLIIEVAPQIGGRISSLQYNDLEVLKIKRDDEHIMWGSTLWPAPQHAWNWPPPPALDKMPYEIVESNDQIIKVCSNNNAYLGLQLCKTISPVAGKSAFEITYSYINNGSKSIAIGFWENTRVPFNGKAYWLNDSTGELSNLEFTEELTRSKKIFIDHAKPILAYRNQGLLFIKIFPVVTTIDIAPEQSPIEIYYDPNNKFVELENHSKYTTIAPGEEMNYQVTWYLMPVEAGDTVKKMIAEIINQ